MPMDRKFQGQNPARLLHEAFSKEFPSGEPTGAERIWALRTESSDPDALPQGSIQTFARFVANARANLDTLALSYFRSAAKEPSATLPIQTLSTQGDGLGSRPPAQPARTSSPSKASLWQGTDGQNALRKLLLTFAARPVYRIWERLGKDVGRTLWYLERVDVAELQEGGFRGVPSPPDEEVLRVLKEILGEKNTTILRQLINVFVLPAAESLRESQHSRSDQEFLQWVLSNEQAPQRLREIAPEILADRGPKGFTKLTALELQALRSHGKAPHRNTAGLSYPITIPIPPSPPALIPKPEVLPGNSPPRGVQFELSTCTLDSLRALVEEHYPQGAPAREILLTVLAYERPNQAWLASPLLRLFGNRTGGDEAIVALWEKAGHHADDRLRRLLHRLEQEPLEAILAHAQEPVSTAPAEDREASQEPQPPESRGPSRVSHDVRPLSRFIQPRGRLLSHGKLRQQINRLPYLRSHQEMLLHLLQVYPQGELAIQRLMEAFGTPRRDGTQRLERLIQQVSLLMLIAENTDQSLLQMTAP